MNPTPPPEYYLNRFFGFNTFKTGQKAVIEKVLTHRSAAAIFPTGAGKSLCYQLPALLLPHMTLVVSPLLSLMKDQLDFLRQHNIPAARLDSTLDRNEFHNVINAAQSGALKILMISAERFKNERFRSQLCRMRVSLMVIDEAHCISEWGHNFRPEYLKLPHYQAEFGIEQVLLLTATATEQVASDMCRKFSIQREDVVTTGFYRKNLFLQVTPVKENDKQNRLLQRIQEAPQSPTIVYVTLQKTAETVAGFLQQHGISAHPYHAGMKNNLREDIQNRFMNGTLNCVVATIAFGMGIDKKDIRRVIHYDLPKSIENYSQEIGRSGRDGEPALCEVLANQDGLHILENFIYGDTPEKSAIHQLLCMIRENNGMIWEIRMTALSKEVNIRLLPLKTLLVYLEMENIIRPKWTFFNDYAFKYLTDAGQIISRFKGERKAFVTAIFNHCHTKQIWTAVDIPAILTTYRTDRRRIITALEYFDEKGWIELKSAQAVDVYDIMNQAFNIDLLTEKLHRFFKTREEREIGRIQKMLQFFESNACISRQLASYFGEDLTAERCGHCSFCTSGRAVLEKTVHLPPLSQYNFADCVADYRQAVGNHFSIENLTKYLCGLYIPLFARFKIKALPCYGRLEHYPFAEVKEWAGFHLKKEK